MAYVLQMAFERKQIFWNSLLSPWTKWQPFTDDIFKCIFMNNKYCILIQTSLKFVPKGLIDNKAVLVQVMAWHQISDKPLSGPMLIQFTDAYMRL